MLSGNGWGRDRWGLLVAVALGTAIVTGTLMLLASAAPVVPERFAAVSVAVQSPRVSTPANPFPETRPWSNAEATQLTRRLGAVPGVTAAVADRTFYAQPVLHGRPSDVREGHGWASAALAPHALVAGRSPAGDREVVVGRRFGIPVGGTVPVLTARGLSDWTVSGLVAADAVYVSDAVAARLSPGVRVIGLLGQPRDALTVPGTVLTGARLGELEPRSDARLRWIGLQVCTAMAALAAFACVFVIASTFALWVNQRRRDLGLLRAVGATPRQIHRMVLREALRLGAAASVIGVLLGCLAAPVLAPVLVDARLQPPSYRIGVHLWPVAVGLLTGPLVAVLGAGIAARRAARTGPLEALRRSEVEERPMTRGRWVSGLACAAVGAAAGGWAAVTDDLTDLASLSLIAAMAVVVAATLLAPIVVPALVRALLWPVRGAVGMVARESALTGARRTASTAAPVLLTVAFAVFVAGNVQTSAGAYADRRGAAVRAGAVLAPDRTPGLTDAAVAGNPGAAVLPTTVYLDSTVATAVGVEPGAAAPAMPALAGVIRALDAPDAVIVSESRTGARTVTVTFADGVQKRLRVVGTAPYATMRADFLMTRETVRAHDPSALTAAILLPAGTPDRPVAVGSRVVDVATYTRAADAEEDRLVWIFTLLLIGVSVGYGAIAVANTLLMATARRAGDFRRLRLAGATPRQVLSAVAAESTVAVAIGGVLGTVSALVALWGAVQGLRAQTGLPVGLHIPWSIGSAAVATCVVLALLSSVLPAWRTR